MNKSWSFHNSIIIILIIFLIIFTFLPHDYPIQKTGIYLTCIVVALTVLTRKKSVYQFARRRKNFFLLSLIVFMLETSLLAYFSGGIHSPFFFLYLIPIIVIPLQFGSVYVFLLSSLAIISVIVQYFVFQEWQIGSILKLQGLEHLLDAIIQIFALTFIGFITYFLIKTEEKNRLQLNSTSRQLEEEKSKAITLSTTIANIDDGVFLVDQKEKIFAWNKAMENITGLVAKDVEGKKIYSLLRVYDQNGQQICTCPSKDRCPEGSAENTALFIHHQAEAYVNSRHLFVDHVSVPLLNPDGEFFATVEILQNAIKEREIQLIGDLAQITKSFSDFEETLKQIINKLARFCHVQKAVIFICDQAGALTNIQFFGVSDDEIEAYRKLSLYDLSYYPNSKIKKNFFSNRATNDSRLDKQTIRIFKIKKYLVYHLKIRNQVIGTLLLVNKKKSNFSLGDLECLDSLSGQIAAIIENAKLYDDLKKSVVRERQFIADVAHELKTPLTSLRNEAELILQRERPKMVYQKTIASLLEGIHSLSTRLKNVLDLTWSTVDTSSNRLQPIDLAAIVSEVEEITEKLGTEKQITVDGKIDGPLLVRGDRDRLTQAIINIVDNAIKYTPAKGKITFKVWGEEQLARIQISDTGLGITKEELPYIFDRFYRGTNKIKELGSGLGLAITKSIIFAHHGRIEAKSQVGKGTIFTITIPRS